MRGEKERMNKLYAVQFLVYSSNSCTIVGLFRDENIAIIFRDGKNEELKKKDGDSLPLGRYIISPLYTDF